MIIYLSLAVALAGVLLYGFAANPKLQVIGIVSFGCGLGAFLLNTTNHALSVIK